MRPVHPLIVWLALAGACADGTDPKATDTDEVEETDATETDQVDTDAPPDTDVPATGETYSFVSHFDAGRSSVSYSGQTARHVLIEDMKNFIGGLTTRLDQGTWIPAEGDVVQALEFYFDGPDDELPHGIVTNPAPVQVSYGDISAGKRLADKIAGNDPVGQHADWSVAFVGWDEPGVTSPESLVRRWFDELEELAVQRSLGNIPTDPAGSPLTKVFLTSNGRDLQQLLQKFLSVSVAFSQGADDYLDDADAGKGLLSDHTVPGEEGAAFTALEHAWDEGFGYFGAARDQAAWTDDQIADTLYRDTFTPDGAIDLTSEYTWGHATNAAKRDRASAATAPTDLTAEAWEGFYEGRRLLADNPGPLTAEQQEQLLAWRDQAVGAWERALAATVVHYVNAVLQDMDAFDSEDYSFADHAKHWSEGKGFALGLQFNPHSPLDDADFAAVHAALGTAPVLPDADAGAIADYADGLREARALIGAAYGFHADNLGDDDGRNGW